MLRHQTARAAPDLVRLLRKAHAAHIEGAFAQAEKLYKAILRHDPDNFDALHLMGFLNHQRGRQVEALLFLAAALKRNAQSVEAHLNYGLALQALDRAEDALASYGNAVAIEPDNADLLNKYGAALLGLGRPQEALAILDRALIWDPDKIELLGNRGNALIKLNRPDEAIISYDNARGVGGDSAQLLTNRAHALRRLNRPEEALADLRTAVALDPNYAEAQFELGMVLLTLGEFEEGWAAYEWRWATGAFSAHRRYFKSPLWTGEQSLNGRTVLLHGEQGLGDTIQFVRYAAHVARLGAAVVLEVQPELVALIAKIEGAAHVIARGEKLIPFDFHCPLMSLPFACKTKMTSIPADVPYLKISETQASNWAKRLRTKKPLVGVAWAGQRSHNNDVNRSMGLSSFAPLFDLADVQFVSLQHDPSTNDRGLLRSHCNVLDVDKDLRSLVDTAALISQLDCVISVDTAVAHLAGALAKPTIVLLPFAADFRWLCGRDDSPWYPTARLFRQSQFGRWENVIEQVRAHLVNLRRVMPAPSPLPKDLRCSQPGPFHTFDR